jgi:CHAT domain-containing protein/tetratricopeptide (TPR) repeat protein
VSDRAKVRFRLPGAESSTTRSRAHGPTTRGGAADASPLLAGVTVQRHFDLSASQRAAGEHVSTPPLDDNDLLALEMEGGLVLYTSAGRLADDLRSIDPRAAQDDVIDLEILRRQTPETRGLGDWVVRGLSVLGLDETWLVGQAVDKAKEWGGDVALRGVSWAGTKAIIWAIEQQLERKPGLYAWREDGAATGDFLAPTPASFRPGEQDTPILVFIHGTGSSTQGSFGAFRGPDAGREWLALREKFKDHIYGFEHRTFSESPIENALALATALPQGARLSVVTHSRGGLVGDLVCAAGYDADVIASSFRRLDPRLEAASDLDRAQLTELAALLAERKFQIERYVRVACPAQGTLLASSHLDAFLSGLLHLIGLVPGLAGTPHYAVVKRVLLQIAKNRTDPRMVPGIEAMLPDSPLAALVGRAEPKEGARVAVVAGDIEGGGVLKKLGVFLTDYFLFEEENNDLVVDTESMFGGIARDHGRYVFDQGDDVSHFRYFANSRTRRALQGWLTSEPDDVLSDFQPIRRGVSATPMQRGAGDITGDRPVVIVLPGIMGSHLARGTGGSKDRVWFDVLGLARGQLREIAFDRQDIAPDGIFRMFYGDLCDHLAATHDVLPFDYDWRQPLAHAAARLAAVVGEALGRTPSQPVRLLTHSMGGLVVRAMLAKHPDVWKRLVERTGGRWIMLGTPNRGSHGAVESLLGLSGSTRKLALLHPPMGLQGVVDLIGSLPGGLQLLPRPGFRDTGNVAHDYYDERFWKDFKRGNDSIWFGKSIGALPATALLAAVKQAWDGLPEDLPNPERIAYVAGYGRETPCGIEREEVPRQRLRMIATPNGDGTVTHDSGLLDVLTRNERVWYMNTDHAGLVASEEHFPALVDLLERGETAALPQQRPALRGTEATFRYEPGPVLYPTQQELERVIIGGRRPPRRRARTRHTLSVSCRAMDLSYAVYPILVGHYEGDAISGAEAQIDRYVLDNRLTLRHHLDAYAGPPGTVAIVLDQQNPAQAALGIRRGAIVVGLGQLGELTVTGLRGAVTHGVLRYLLQLRDASTAERGTVGLTSLLLGHNSTTHISVQDSVNTVILAVMEANRRFADSSGLDLRVERLEFVELFEDVAISAAKALREVAARLERDAERLGFRLEPAPALECGEGMRARLEAVPSAFGYWPRMIVSAVQPDGAPAPEPKPGQPVIASGLRYLFLSMRARAETVEQQRQPGLVEQLLDKSVRFPVYQRDLARALFHLLVPNEFKEAARQTDSLVLVVDGYTANLPWEMLVADDEPLVKNTAVVRQLASSRFRAVVRSSQDKRAYVIGNPSTTGYYKAFPRPSSGPAPALPPPGATAALPAQADAAAADGLPSLAGAELEARAVADLLQGQGYQVTEAPPGSEAVDVINRLYERPFRILHVSAHGVFQAGTGSRQRTGVVLSDGLLLTAAEIGALERVPDLVFLNCCFTGRVDAGPETAYNRLAYSVARELIECGVRVVIAAGWAVDDTAARHFSERFYRSFLSERRPFGKAVQEARVATLESFPDSNTWGAFQAYGEPSFVMDPESLPLGGTDDFRPVAPQELVARIDLLRNEIPRQRARGGRAGAQLPKAMERLLRRGTATSWAEDPQVLYALGRLYSDAGDFVRAREAYEGAIAQEDKRGQVPVTAIEQLANLEARHGASLARAAATRDAGEALIRRAIHRLEALVTAAGGAGEPPGALVNTERCALVGSAHKRLATISQGWPSRRAALVTAASWYGRGEQDPDAPAFSAYNTHNRLALEAVLGVASRSDAELARRAGEIAGGRYAKTRDYFDAVMVADGYLIAALITGRLENPGEAVRASHEIVDRYRDLRTKLPETARWLDSVVSQIDLLAQYYETPGRPGPGATVAGNLRGIAAALAPPSRGVSPAPTSPAPSPPSAPLSRDVVGTAPERDPDPIEILDRVRHYRDASRWEDLIRSATEAPSSATRLPEVRHLLALALSRRAAPGDHDRAIQLLEQLAAEKPRDPDIAGSLGHIHKERFEAARSANDTATASPSLEQALRWFRAALAIDPKDTYAGFNFVRLALQRQENATRAELEAVLPRVRDALTNRIASDPGPPDPSDLAMKIQLAAIAGDWPEAEAATRDFVTLAEATAWAIDAARRDLLELATYLPTAAGSHMQALQALLTDAKVTEPRDG